VNELFNQFWENRNNNPQSRNVNQKRNENKNKGRSRTFGSHEEQGVKNNAWLNSQ